MKRTLFGLMLGLLLLCCCAAMAETTPLPMPTQPPLMQDAPDDLVLYYNPDGGVKYHLNPRCVSVHTRYLPLAGQFLYDELNDAPYAALKPCMVCGAPLRSEESESSAPAATAVPTAPPVPVWVNSQPVTDYQRETPIAMPAGDEYLTVDFGVTTWRGDSFRTNAAVGTLDAAPTGLEVVWTVETATDSTGVHAGFSWYSQPAIIQWPKELRASMNLTEEAANTTALKEVIFASLDGQIYFLNLADGTATREAITPGYPMLGAVTVHPLGYPLLMAGQYSASLPYVSGSIGLNWYELLTQHQLRFIDGTMAALGVADADSGAFNTSALIDRNTNTAIALSKDGYLYTEALDMRFIVDGEQGQVMRMNADFLQPVWAKVTAADEQVTSAPVMCGSRLWFGTSKGRILCVDTTTMQPLWSAQVAQTIYALSMEQDENGQLWLYTGSATGGIPDGMSSTGPMQFFRINADTGETDWTATLDTRLVIFYEGALGACAVGENALDDLVFFALSDVPGRVIALDKATGEVRWQHEMGSECRSSPVAVYTEDGQGWIVQTDESGLMTLLDGLTGEEVASLDLGGDGWSSPAVFGDMLVIGTRVCDDYGHPTAGRIYGVRINSPQDAPADPLSRLTDFLSAWSANDQAAMLALCSPAWQAQQANPELALFKLVMNRTALAWDIAEQGTEGNDLLYAANVLLDRNNGGEPVEYRFTLRVSLESSEYYIIPDGLASGVKVE